MLANIDRNYRTAFFLSLFTIIANLVEGVFSTILGQKDGTLALFGFGLDSFIEVISAVGISMMILRIARSPDSPRSKFEITALKITGVSFYLLTAGLVITAILNLVTKSKPETAIKRFDHFDHLPECDGFPLSCQTQSRPQAQFRSDHR